jgi:hypothetical protein
MLAESGALVRSKSGALHATPQRARFFTKVVLDQRTQGEKEALLVHQITARSHMTDGLGFRYHRCYCVVNRRTAAPGPAWSTRLRWHQIIEEEGELPAVVRLDDVDALPRTHDGLVTGVAGPCILPERLNAKACGPSAHGTRLAASQSRVASAERLGPPRSQSWRCELGVHLGNEGRK